MKASQIKIGTVYAVTFNRYSAPEPYKIVGRDEITGDWTVEKTSRNQTGPLRTSVTSREIVESWDARTDRLRDEAERRQRSIDVQREHSDHIAALLGPKVASEFAHYYEFKVYNDGSFGTEVGRLFRSTLREMLEAAYASGQQSTQPATTTEES